MKILQNYIVTVLFLETITVPVLHTHFNVVLRLLLVFLFVSFIVFNRRRAVNRLGPMACHL